MGDFKEFIFGYAEKSQRYFEPANPNLPYVDPIRSTKYSAGYDLYAAESVLINPGSISIVSTNTKVKMPHNEYFQVSLRSSLGLKGLILPNAPGIIDSDYYNTERPIGIILYNASKNDIIISRGDKIAQGVFLKYLTTLDEVGEERKGGFGSSGK